MSSSNSKSNSSSFTYERDTLMNSVKNRRHVSPPGGTSVQSPQLYAVSPDAKLLYIAGGWDNSLRVYNIARSKPQAYVIRHQDSVTCVALDYCGRRLITGSRDRTSMIWDVTGPTGVCPSPLHILCGHKNTVTCVAIATELDMAVSGSRDGCVIIHTVKHGVYMRTLRPPREKGRHLSVEKLAVSDIGQICVYCQHLVRSTTTASPDVEKMTVHMYSVNGKHLSFEAIHSGITDMLITGNYLIFGNVSGVVVIKELNGLRTVSSVALQSRLPVTCLTVTSPASHILAGTKDSTVVISAQRLTDLK